MRSARIGVWALFGLLFLSVQAEALDTSSGFVERDNARLAWRSLGRADGAPLLLLMGWAGTMEVWDQDLLAGLAAERRVILLDNRGMGASTSSIGADVGAGVGASIGAGVEAGVGGATAGAGASRAPSRAPAGASAGMGGGIAPEIAPENGTEMGAAPGADPISIVGMAEDAAAVLQALGVARADVLGWSMGSCVAQELALAHPELVRKLALYGSVCEPSGVKEVLDRMGAMDGEALAGMLFPRAWAEANPEVWARLPSPSSPPDPAIVARQKAAIETWPGTCERLKDIAAPALLLVGDADPVTPPAHSLAMARALPTAWLARFAGGGHWLMYQNGRDLARLINLFLETRQELVGE